MNQTQPSQQLISTPIPINNKNAAGSIQSQYKKSSTTTQLVSEAQRIDIQPSHGIDLKMKSKAIVETPQQYQRKDNNETPSSVHNYINSSQVIKESRRQDASVLSQGIYHPAHPSAYPIAGPRSQS